MLSHVPIFAHGNVRSVLIIGGGDGGMLREVLRHKEVERVTQAEIDLSVIEMSKKYLPNISRGAFDNKRARIVISDGAEYVKHCEEKYDVIICDTTDPIGPGASLFTKEFYRNCHDCLSEGGILVTQNGVPFLQEDELIGSYEFLSESFDDVAFYAGVTPTYVGGFMTFGWASDNPAHRQVSLEEIEKRVREFDGSFQYYTPAVHQGSFALPQFILNKLNYIQNDSKLGFWTRRLLKFFSNEEQPCS
jgi:spermidine synthase